MQVPPPVAGLNLRFLLLGLSIFLFSFALCENGFAQSPFQTSHERPKSPNIVVILVDDMGVMDTSVPFLTDENGFPKRYPLNDFYRTPNMEKLAANGIRFSNFNAMSVCSPTRISLMTGQNSARHHTTNWINGDRNNGGTNSPPEWNWMGLQKGDLTLPGLLREKGYHTIHVGKGHFGPRVSSGTEPLNLGFDINIGGTSIGQPPSYDGKQNYSGNKRQNELAIPGLEKYHGKDVFLTEALTQEAKLAIDQASKFEKPFFLYFAHYAVHAPFNSDHRFAKNYEKSDKPATAQAFATLIEGMDKSLGDLVQHLEHIGVAEDTLIFFLGDNGSDAPLGHQHAVACAAPLRGRKGSHYEGGVRVPFIASWAKPNASSEMQKQLPITSNACQSQLANVTDLFPTISRIANVSIPKTHVVDGEVLDKLLTGAQDPNRNTSFLVHYPHAPHRSDYWTSYRDSRWKAIYHYFPSEVSNNSHYQLFDLQKDPFESNDLSNEQPAELRRMVLSMKEELEEHKALFPVNEKGIEVTLQIP